MYKRHIPYIVSCIFIITLIIISIIVLLPKKESTKNISQTKNEHTKSDEIISAKSEKNTEEKYTIKAENGVIYVFNSDKDIIKTLNINYNQLREYDKKEFDKGVTVTSLEEILRIIEDFSN